MSETSAPIRFGTDGVRAEAGTWPLTEAGVRRMGRGIAAWAGGPGATVVIGRDPRESGPGLESALVEGLVEGGAAVIRLGVLPTAAVSCAAAAEGADAGIMLTASHNPWHDNGVKVLMGTGRKPTDTAGLEAAFVAASTPGGGDVRDHEDGAAAWRAAMPDVDLRGKRILLDCASGAAHGHAARVLRACGAEVVEHDAPPNGRNINAGVGALHPPGRDALAAAGCQLGICLDGDADRIALVDAEHGLLDGDDLLWLLCGAATGPVIGTVMSNGGLEAALGGRLVRTPVGDKHVAAELARTGAPVGAEPSGHVLFEDGLPTGDGLYTALRVLQTLAGGAGAPPLPLPAGGWTRWPVAQDAVRFQGARVPLEALETPEQAREAGNRLVVRYSGTEPKLRILVEGRGEGDGAPAAWVARIRAEFEAALPA